MDIEAMVSKGYFPEEITPAFVTKDLAKLLPVILNNIESYNKTGDRTRITKLISYSIPKIRAYRRTIGIPNPISFIWLSKTIIDHWTEITDFTDKSAFSLSRIHQNDFSNRAISPPVFSAITRERILRSTGFRYALKIDILRFYGNIYTHSIPLALHGKPLSKSKRKRTDLFGNALDEDVRNMQDGQTMGIPLGPDTSRVISEIIVSHIDVELSKQITNIKGIRVVDDYTLYFKTAGELELGRSIILKLLREFELDLNQAKEKVIDLPEQIESDWYNHLREFRFRNEHDLQLKDLIAYFDLSFFTLVNIQKKA